MRALINQTHFTVTKVSKTLTMLMVSWSLKGKLNLMCGTHKKTVISCNKSFLLFLDFIFQNTFVKLIH